MNALDVQHVLEGEIGYAESPPGSNHTKYCDWYGLTGPWCDMFQCWAFDRAGASAAIGGKFAYTPAHANWFRKNGQWGTTPKVGALVFFAWNLGRIAHVGFVTGVNSDGSIETIEGNTDEAGGRTGGKVMRRRRNSGIVGYGYPAYDNSPAPPPVAPPVAPPIPQPVAPPAQGLAVDGDFGPATIKALQQTLNDTGANPKLAVDGQYGPGTKRALQARLNYTNGPVAIDGNVGPQTIRALQAHVGVAQDGNWGPYTTKKLQETINAGRF